MLELLLASKNGVKKLNSYGQVGDWQNLSGFGREQEKTKEKKEEKVEAEKEEERDVMTRW